jgi:hypothetical protein
MTTIIDVVGRWILANRGTSRLRPAHSGTAVPSGPSMGGHEGG